MRRIVRTVFLTIDIAIVVLFFAGYLAYHVRPTVFWWFELVAIGLPYLSVLIALLGIGLVLARQWQLAALHGVLILLVLLRTNPLDRFNDTPPAGGDTLSVMTFNVPRWWGHLMPEKTLAMSALIQETRPDLVGLQEAPIAYHKEAPRRRAAPYVAVLYDSLGYDTISRESTGATYTPQPILAKLQLLDQEEFELSLHSDDSTRTHVTRTLLRWGDREFVAYNVHLRTFGEKKPWQEERMPLLEPANLIPYLRQYRNAYRVRAWEVERIVELVKGEELPVLLLGDLNSTPDNWVHGRLSSVLKDAFAEEGRGWGKTYHTRLPVVRIDFVFVSEHWDVISARVVDAYLSDHLPLLVELKLK